MVKRVVFFAQLSLKNSKESKQITPIKGPGERLKVIASKKPKKEKRIPNPEERNIAECKLDA